MMLIKEEGPNEAGNKIYTFADMTKFEVPQKYKVAEVIGRGAYGHVCSAVNTNTGDTVAVKCVGRLFNDAVDAKRVLREVKMLGFLNHRNIIGLKDVFFNGSPESFSELYMVTDLMEMDMQRMLNSSLRMGMGHCQYFTLQLLCALQYVHSAHIIHRDLKPANLLTDRDCNLKLCDFGLARGYYGPVLPNRSGGPAAGSSGGAKSGAAGSGNMQAGNGAASRRQASQQQQQQQPEKEMTQYVITRPYRAPELLLVCSSYDYAVDIWGVGCIAVEMVTKKPLFPGRDYIHQMNLIIELLGMPDFEKDLPQCTSTEAINYLKSMPPVKRKTLKEYCPALYQRFHDASFLDSFEDEGPTYTAEEALELFERFLFALLKYKPSARLTAKEAVAHPWLEQARCGETEVAGCEAASCYAWEYDDKTVSLPQLRHMFVQEVREFRTTHSGEN